MSYYTLVPDDFEVPTRVETDRFVVVPLILDRFAIDYESYASSVEHLQKTYSVDESLYIGPGLQWPAGVSIRMALLDAAFCEMAFFHLRSQFAYEVLDRSETRQLGCVYVFPTTRKGYEAEARMWVREDELKNGLDEAVHSWFRPWVETVWPFQRVAWPGREIPWEDWMAMPLKER
jgi:hypothetical protein